MNASQMDYEFKLGYDAIAGLSAPAYNEREKSTFLTKAQEQIVYEIINQDYQKYKEGVEQTEKKRVDLTELVQAARCTPSTNQTGTLLYGTFFDLPTDFFYTLQENAYASTPNCKEAGKALIELDGATMNSATAHFLVGETITSGSATYTIDSGSGRHLVVINTGTTTLSVGDTITGSTSGATGTILLITNVLTDLYVKVITHDQYTINVSNPFKCPSSETCWRMDYQRQTPGVTPRRHELITDGTYTIEDYYIRYFKRPEPIIVPTRATFPAFTIDGITAAPGFVGYDCRLDASVHREIVDTAVRLAVAALTETNSYQIKAVESAQSE